MCLKTACHKTQRFLFNYILQIQHIGNANAYFIFKKGYTSDKLLRSLAIKVLNARS